VVTPKRLTKDQRKIMEQLAEIEDKDLSEDSLMDKVRNIFG
jgi:DnaJ-class molecular chaperone